MLNACLRAYRNKRKFLIILIYCTQKGMLKTDKRKTGVIYTILSVLLNFVFMIIRSGNIFTTCSENEKVELYHTLRTAAFVTGGAAEGSLRLSRSSLAKKYSGMKSTMVVNPVVVQEWNTSRSSPFRHLLLCGSVCAAARERELSAAGFVRLIRGLLGQN